MEVNTEPGIAKILRQGSQGLFTLISEVFRLVRKLPGLAIFHFVDAHRGFEVEAKMEKLHLERIVVVTPKRFFGAKADRLVIVPGQILQRAGQLPFM